MLNHLGSDFSYQWPQETRQVAMSQAVAMSPPKSSDIVLDGQEDQWNSLSWLSSIKAPPQPVLNIIVLVSFTEQLGFDRQIQSLMSVCVHMCVCVYGSAYT